MRRLRDFLRIAALERDVVVYPELAASRPVHHQDRIDSVSRSVFGVSYEDLLDWAEEPVTALVLNDLEDDPVAAADAAAAYDERWDQIWDAEIPEGEWDLTDELGRDLLVGHHFTIQLAAAIAGIGGATLPPEGSEIAESWAAKLQAPPPVRRPSVQIAPISDDERRRRNREAKNSTVWRPGK